MQNRRALLGRAFRQTSGATRRLGIWTNQGPYPTSKSSTNVDRETSKTRRGKEILSIISWNMVLHGDGVCRWDGVDVHPYKEDGTIFKSVTRQTLSHGTSNLPVELRYFEVGAGGHSTLERHQHSHLVTVVQGSGQVLVGDQVHEIGHLDVVQIPPMTWHQFQATRGEVLGFLCVVHETRDRPQRPNEEELTLLNQSQEVADFIKV